MPILLLTPNFSYLLALGLIFIHLMAALAVLFSQLNTLIQMVLILFLLLSLVYSFYRHSLFIYPQRIVACCYRGESWTIQLRDQSIKQVDLMPESYINTVCSILHFKDIDTAKKYVLLLPHDAIKNEKLAALRRLLKLIHFER